MKTTYESNILAALWYVFVNIVHPSSKNYKIRSMMDMLMHILQIAVSCACNRDYRTINKANVTIINTHCTTYTAQPILQPTPLYWSRCKEEHTLTHNANVFIARGPFIFNQGLNPKWTKSTWKRKKMKSATIVESAMTHSRIPCVSCKPPISSECVNPGTCCNKIPLLVSNMGEKQNCTCLQTQMFYF